jgi:hypothetical protein
MGLAVFYPENIANALLAAEQAANATAKATGDQNDPFSAGYLTGYRAALTTLAVAFGLVPQPSIQAKDPVWRPITTALSLPRGNGL